jgi:hypothetical protein
MTDEPEETEDTEPTTNTPPINTPIVIGRMELSAERAELSDERPVSGRLDVFPPHLLAAALRGEYVDPAVAKTANPDEVPHE